MGDPILAERALLVEFGLAIDSDGGADPAALLAALRAAGARRARTPSQQPLFEAIFAMTGADFSQPVIAAPPYAALGHALDMLRQQLQQDFVHAEQLSALLEALPLQIVIALPDGTIRDANRLAAAALPQPPPATLQALLGVETLSEDMGARELAQGQRTVLVSVGSIRLGSGVLAGWVCTGVDVSLQASARAALEEARATAEATLRARTAFLQSISHEIRTPLSGIQAAAEALQHEPLGEGARPLVSAILTSGAVLSAMVEQILCTVSQEAGLPAREPALLQAAAPVTLEGAQVLVVDDHPINRLVAERLLRAQGAQVSVASGGAEALCRLEECGFSVVLMDCLMPDLDGYETTRRYRCWEASQADRARVPIVALTASATDGELVRCTEAGMDGLLEKPLDPAALAHQLGLIMFNFRKSSYNDDKPA